LGKGRRRKGKVGYPKQKRRKKGGEGGGGQTSPRKALFPKKGCFFSKTKITPKEVRGGKKRKKEALSMGRTCWIKRKGGGSVLLLRKWGGRKLCAADNEKGGGDAYFLTSRRGEKGWGGKMFPSGKREKGGKGKNREKGGEKAFSVWVGERITPILVNVKKRGGNSYNAQKDRPV